MGKATFLYILFVFFVIAGCGGPVEVEPNTKTVVVPGELTVQFVGNVDITEAYALMDELDLRAIDFRNLELEEEANWATVGVPEGKEEYWSFMLTHYPIVVSAHLKTKEVPI